MKMKVNEGTTTDTSERCKTGFTNAADDDDDSSLGLGVAAEYARARARWRVRQLSRPKSTPNSKAAKETSSAILALPPQPLGGSRRRSFACSTSVMERTPSATTVRRSASSVPKKTFASSLRRGKAAAPQDELRRGEGHLPPDGTNRVGVRHGVDVDTNQAIPSVDIRKGEGGGDPTTRDSTQSHHATSTTSFPPELEDDDYSALEFQSALSILGIADNITDDSDCDEEEDQLRDTIAELRRTIPLTVRTSGLRPGRENSLIDSFQELVSADQSLTQRYTHRLSKWKEFANRIVLHASSLLRQRDEALALAEGGRRDAIEEATRVKEEAERAIAEAQEQIRAVAETGRAAEEEVLRVKETLAKELEQQLLAVHREAEKETEQRVEEATSRVKLESEVQAADLKVALAEAKERYEAVLAEEKDRCDALQRQLFEERGVNRRFEAELDLQRQRFLEEKEATCEKMRSELKSGFRRDLEVAKKQRDALQIALDRAQRAKTEETEECEKRRRNELRGVETKVRDILRKKDEQLREALERAKESEQHASSMERLLEELDIGFVQQRGGQIPAQITAHLSTE